MSYGNLLPKSRFILAASLLMFRSYFSLGANLVRIPTRLVVFLVVILAAFAAHAVAQEQSPREREHAFVKLYESWKLSETIPAFTVVLGEELLAKEHEVENWPLPLPRDLIKAEVWAGIGTAYQQHPDGNRADHLEKAIGAYNEALEIYTRERWPNQWADVKINLGAAYQVRIRGNKADNMERAIASLEEALTIATQTANPSAWVDAQTNLGVIYQHRIAGDRADNQEKAIEAFQSALGAIDQTTAPLEWSRLQSNLGNVYQNRLRGGAADNLDKAIAAYEAATATRGVYDRSVRGMTWHNYGLALHKRFRGSANNMIRATFALEQAVFYRNDAPYDHMVSSRHLGAAFLETGQWAKAASAYADARKSFDTLFARGIEEANANSLIAQAGPLFAEAAFAATKQGDNKGALDLAAEGRALLMSVALKLETLSGDTREELDRLRESIREIERSLDKSKGTELTASFKTLEGLRDELAELLRLAEAPDSYVRIKELHARLRAARRELEAQGQPDASSDEIERLSGKLFSQPEAKPPAAQVRAILANGGALVVPIVTQVGGSLLIVRAGPTSNPLNITRVDLSQFKASRVHSLMHGDGKRPGWLAAYNVNYLHGAELDRQWPKWLAAVEALGPQLWDLFGAGLHQGLQRAGVKSGERIFWLPSAGLGIIPLGIAKDPVSKRRLADTYEIVYAPSLHALDAAQANIATAAPATLAAIVNPTQDLAGAEEEGKLVASYFADNDRSVLERAEATPDAVLAALKGKTHWHFASHGTFSWEDARQSALLMHDQARPSVGRLLETGGLGRPRLVVLSACETGLYDINRNPDEFIGLPGTFTALGAAGVLGTLWPVSDAATALLMAKFYELHMGSKLAPPTALRQAQSWLRQATNADLTAYAKLSAEQGRLESRHIASIEQALSEKGLMQSRNAAAIEWIASRQSPSTNKASRSAKRLARPYAHPYFWAGFIHTGL